MPRKRWSLVLPIVWSAIAIPYTIAGPDDLEEYFTAVTATKMAIDSLVAGALPFWNVDLALGMPQPLRFHFITHPLSPLCGITDCHMVLRGIASLHVLLGALFIALLVKRLTSNTALISLAAVTFCLSSSVVQPLLTDDWPMTAINESSLPVLLYAVLAISDTSTRTRALLWTLVLGGFSGLLLSMSFPFLPFLLVGIAAVTAPHLRQRLPWLLLAGGIAALIGGAHVLHLYEQFRLTPHTVGRLNHPDPDPWLHVWSTFLRPLALTTEPASWRTVFIGPPFAIAAIIAAVLCRDSAVRPFQVGLLVSTIGLLLPAQFVLNLNTAQWTFRTGLNTFGIVLGAYGLHSWFGPPSGVHARTHRILLTAQISCLLVAVLPVWYSVAAAAAGVQPSDSLRLAPGAGIATEIAKLHQSGRVMFGPRAHKALRELEFNSAGLAPNQLQILGIPSLSSVAYGITADDLYPMPFTFQSETKPDLAAATNSAFLNVLGVRHVVAFGDEMVAPGLKEIGHFARDLRIYENPDAWPEAFFVDAIRDGPVPRLPDCSHSRFLCADFSHYDLGRVLDPVEILRIHDGLTLSFPPVERARDILVTQWYRDGWTVTEGRGSVVKATEQFVGLHVASGESRLTIRFRPPVRSWMFFGGVVTELVVGVTLLICLVRQRS